MAEDSGLVARLYVGLAIDRDFTPRPGRLTVGDIVRFIGGETSFLTAEQTRQLLASPSLVRWYRQRLAALSIAELPRVAAASSGEIARRRFEGGLLTVSESFGTFASIFIELEDVQPPALDLVLMSARGIARLPFQGAADENGKIVEMVDTATPQGGLIVEMLCDPLSTGWLVARPD